MTVFPVLNVVKLMDSTVTLMLVNVLHVVLNVLLVTNPPLTVPTVKPQEEEDHNVNAQMELMTTVPTVSNVTPNAKNAKTKVLVLLVLMEELERNVNAQMEPMKTVMTNVSNVNQPVNLVTPTDLARNVITQNTEKEKTVNVSMVTKMLTMVLLPVSQTPSQIPSMT